MASLVIRLYRIVHAPVFLRCFASDRRHMKDSDGNWTAEPPLHEPIVAEGNDRGQLLFKNGLFGFDIDGLLCYTICHNQLYQLSSKIYTLS